MFAAKRYTVPAGALLILHQLCAALVPVVMGLAIDRAIAPGNAGQLMLWVVVLAVDYALVSMTFRFGSRIGFLGMQSIQHHVRTTITDRILDARGMGGQARQPGMLLSIATSDARQLAMSVAIVVYPLGEFAAVVFSALILLYISWPLGLAIAVAAPLMLLLMDVAGSPLRRRSMHEQQAAGDASATAADLVGGFRIVKGLGAEPEADRRYTAASERALSKTQAANVARAGYLGAMETVSGLFIAGVAVAAGLMALRGAMTIGQLITVVAVTQFVMGPLQAFAANFGAIWAQALASAERVLTILQAPPLREYVDTDGAPGGSRSQSKTCPSVRANSSSWRPMPPPPHGSPTPSGAWGKRVLRPSAEETCAISTRPSVCGPCSSRRTRATCSTGPSPRTSTSVTRRTHR